MKDQTLAAVDEKLVKTGKFLESVSSDPKKLQCLNYFTQCQEVIRWLRDVTNSKRKQFILYKYYHSTKLCIQEYITSLLPWYC